jgi:hypothetical protein
VKQKSAALPDGEQPGRVQSRAWPGLSLSVQEIRRVLWRMVLAVQQTASHILAWSHWRRRHQAIAKYDHDRRRGRVVETLAA